MRRKRKHGTPRTEKNKKKFRKALVDLKDPKYKRRRLEEAVQAIGGLGVTPEDIAGLAQTKKPTISPAKIVAVFPGYRDQVRGRKLFKAAISGAAVASEYAVKRFKKSLPHNEGNVSWRKCSTQPNKSG